MWRDAEHGAQRKPLVVRTCSGGRLCQLLLGLGFAVLTNALCVVARVEAGEQPLVALRSVDPSIKQDIRYAGADNFTGRRVAGYEAAECWLRPQAARALAKVQADLLRDGSGLSLKVFDCYRPKRAVSAFMTWAEAAEDGGTRSYHPNVARSQLVPRGYIASVSTHSKGIAVDLTLVRSQAAKKGNSEQQAMAVQAEIGKPLSCTQTSDRAADAASLDMGTAFDCFDPKSRTASAGLTAEQRQARQTLKRAMERHGFANYAKEWWHFTFGAADDGRVFDVPVVAVE